MESFKERFGAKVLFKLQEANPIGVQFPLNWENEIGLIVDGMCNASCAPGTGPNVPGVNAARRDPLGDLQNWWFTGWLKMHGVKKLTVLAPNGCTIVASNNYSIARHDNYILGK